MSMEDRKMECFNVDCESITLQRLKRSANIGVEGDRLPGFQAVTASSGAAESTDDGGNIKIP